MDIRSLITLTHALPFISLSATLADVQQQLKEDTEVIIGDTQPLRVCTLAQASTILDLRMDQKQKLAACIDQLPIPVILDIQSQKVELDVLAAFAQRLAENEAPGLIVYQHMQLLGVILTTTIIDVLPESYLDISWKRNLNSFNVPVHKYTCRLCEQSDPPPYVVEVIQGDIIPPCSKNWLHGNTDMKELKA